MTILLTSATCRVLWVERIASDHVLFTLGRDRIVPNLHRNK